MNLKDIIAKLEEAGVDAGVITAVEALDTSAEVERLSGELDAEKGKNAGILSDKKKYKERAEVAEKTLSDAEREKLPEKERIEAEKQELRDKLAAAESEREADATKFAKTQRDAKISDLTGSVHWATGTPQPTAKLIISQALADVDLSDQAKVDEVLNSVKETHKSFIAAEAPGGSGSKGGTGGKDNGGGGEASNIADNQKAIWGDK